MWWRFDCRSNKTKSYHYLMSSHLKFHPGHRVSNRAKVLAAPHSTAPGGAWTSTPTGTLSERANVAPRLRRQNFHMAKASKINLGQFFSSLQQCPGVLLRVSAQVLNTCAGPKRSSCALKDRPELIPGVHHKSCQRFLNRRTHTRRASHTSIRAWVYSSSLSYLKGCGWRHGHR